MVTDERYFLLVLFRCERAWAYSMQLKQVILTHKNTQIPRQTIYLEELFDTNYIEKFKPTIQD
jgi:hypothetical protein